MTSQLEHIRPVAVPDQIGQATAVEQSRAIAEVQAQVVVAQRMPRDVDRAVAEALRSCGQRSLAEKAFYRYPRAGQQVTGESIVLAKELARCWGNIDYGIAELRRDDAAGESEMMAFAWDLQTNTRPRTTFIVPHVLDTTNGRKHLRDVRDIYENNANMGARRMREMILNVLPPWLVEDAKAECYKTLAGDDRDGKTLAERAATAVGRYERIGIRADQLVRKIGAPQNRWSAGDLGQLAVIWRSIERGETTAEAEFGIAAPAVTAADILPQADAGRKPGRRAAAPKEPADRPTGAASAAASAEGSGTGAPASGQTARPAALAATGQVGMIITRLEKLGIPEADREARLRVAGKLARREQPIGSTKELTQDEARDVIRELDRCKEPVDLHARLAELDALLAEGTVPGGE